MTLAAMGQLRVIGRQRKFYYEVHAFSYFNTISKGTDVQLAVGKSDKLLPVNLSLAELQYVSFRLTYGLLRRGNTRTCVCVLHLKSADVCVCFLQGHQMDNISQNTSKQGMTAAPRPHCAIYGPHAPS